MLLGQLNRDLMRLLLIPLSLASAALVTAEAAFTAPEVPTYTFPEKSITSGSKKDLCKKYRLLFLEVLHESLACSEDLGIPPEEEEHCARVSALLKEYSQLHSKYCYDEDWETITL